ncbi:Uncharacterised protein [Mycobacterium tuberculosis]|nr:Uncharacterised protein [Mycobacterium tuberculosis]
MRFPYRSFEFAGSFAALHSPMAYQPNFYLIYHVFHEAFKNILQVLDSVKDRV